MVVKYLKLKYSILYKRFIREHSKEERTGIVFGYLIIMGVIFGIAYLIYHYFFKDNDKIIRTAIFSLYFLITIISAFGLFDKIHDIFFENKDREILFLLPCKPIDIMLIKFFELLIGFFENFWLILLPVTGAYLLIFPKFVVNLLFLIFASIAIGIFMVSLVMVVILLSSNITKGKNTKALSVVLSIIFTALSYYIALFLSENFSDVFKENVVYSLFFYPFIKVSNAILADATLDLVKSILFCYLYVLPLITITYGFFKYSIKQGFLYYQDKQGGNRILLNLLVSKFSSNTIFTKGVKEQKAVQNIAQKDILSMLSSWDYIKIAGQLLFITIIVLMRLGLEKNGIGIWVIIIIKSTMLVYITTNFIFEYEYRNFQLFPLSGISNYAIIKGKSNALYFLNILGAVIIDACLFKINHTALTLCMAGIIIDACCVIISNYYGVSIVYLGIMLQKDCVIISSANKLLCFLGVMITICVVSAGYLIVRAFMVENTLSIFEFISGTALLYMLLGVILFALHYYLRKKIEYKEILIKE